MDVNEYRAQEWARMRMIRWGVRIALMSLVAAVTLGMWGCPTYSVWQQGLVGEGELRRAEQNRKIAVQEAQAKQDAAKALAAAEVERARGVSEANRIIADGLGGPEGYLRWLWIDALKAESNSVIYVPTEANLPILEATRRVGR